MPATAGRVRMPHNNRMSTSGALKTTSIWQKTIGHDPHAEQDGSAAPSEAEHAAATAKAENVMLVARQQNLTGDSNRDDFARKLYTGLKGGKKRRADGNEIDVADIERQRELQRLLEEDESSSEEEYQIVVEVAKDERKKESKRKDKKNKKHKLRKKSSSRRRGGSDDDSSSESVDSEDERRRRKRRKDKKKHKHRKRSHSSDESECSDDDSLSCDRHHRKNKHRKSYRSKRDEPPLDPFIAAEQYAGSKKGYVFKSGDKGLGYYEDTVKKTSASRSLPPMPR